MDPMNWDDLLVQHGGGFPSWLMLAIAIITTLPALVMAVCVLRGIFQYVRSFLRHAALALVLLSCISYAHAQPAQPALLFDVPGGGAAQQQLTPAQITTAGQAFANAAPLTIDIHLYRGLYTIFSEPIDNFIHSTISALAGQFGDLLRAVASVVVVMGLLSSAMSSEVAAHISFSPVIRYTARVGILIALLGSAGLMEQFIVEPVRSLPDSISQVLLNGSGTGTDIGTLKSGDAFDQISTRALTASVVAFKAASAWTLEGLALGIASLGVGVFSMVAIAYIAVFVLPSYLLLGLLLAVSPLFVTSLVAPQTRHFFSCYVAAVGSVIGFIVMSSALLALMLKAAQGPVDLIMHADATANIFGLFGSCVGILAVLIISCMTVSRLSDICVGLFGGIYSNANHYMSAITSAAGAIGSRGMASASASAASGSVTTTRATSPTGPMMGGSRP